MNNPFVTSDIPLTGLLTLIDYYIDILKNFSGKDIRIDEIPPHRNSASLRLWNALFDKSGYKRDLAYKKANELLKAELYRWRMYSPDKFSYEFLLTALKNELSGIRLNELELPKKGDFKALNGKRFKVLFIYNFHYARNQVVEYTSATGKHYLEFATKELENIYKKNNT